MFIYIAPSLPFEIGGEKVSNRPIRVLIPSLLTLHLEVNGLENTPECVLAEFAPRVFASPLYEAPAG